MTISSPPTISAPASCASRSLSPEAITRTLFDFPEPVRQHDRAADHLIGVLRIDAQTHVQLDGLVELGELDLLNERNRFVQLVGAGFYLLGRSFILLTVFLAFLLIGADGRAHQKRVPASH